MTSEDLYIYIDELIRQNVGFAVWRIPGETHIRLVKQEGPPETPDNLESLNKKKGFVVAPFHITAQTPLALINGKEEQITPEDEKIPASIPTTSKAATRAGSDYAERFHAFTGELNSGRLDKLVLSRKSEYPRPESFAPGKTFLKACKWYIRSYVYLCHTPQTGTWLGSTPEIILAGEGKSWHTVALAGTRPLCNGRLPEVWDEKNRKEQELVAEYIRNQLATLGIKADEEGPYTVRAAELAHLKSDFSFTLPGSEYLGGLLKLLHPTPAVCGLPKEEAYRFILENEGYDRRYYSGFVGMLDWENGSNLYVNLRCMQIFDDKLCLYAGGGLLASSILEEEWQETEDKLFTMRRVIQ